jgi:hypothetical protein
MGTSGDVQRATRSSAVSLRGWNFPHINERDSSNFNEGFQSTTDWKNSSFGRHVEVVRGYRSGLFVWRSTLWEEQASEFSGAKVLCFLAAIFSVTEWMIFTQRYYEPVLRIDESIELDLTLHGSMNRALVSRPPASPLFSEYVSKAEPVRVKKVVELTDLRTDPLAVARRLIVEIFELFNWNNSVESVIEGWQRSLIEKRI